MVRTTCFVQLYATNADEKLSYFKIDFHEVILFSIFMLCGNTDD